MEFSNSLLQQLAADVLNGMFGFDVSPIPVRCPLSSGMTARIRISGDWEADLEIATTAEGASTLATQMFALPASDLQEDEIADALGEIANMIGGNLKGVRPGETTLSIPCVGTTSTMTASADSDPDLSLHLLFSNQPLFLRVSCDAGRPGPIAYPAPDTICI